MIVYQLNRCEEYFMQEDHGIFASQERAIKEVADKHKVLITHKKQEAVYIITVDPNHYAHPPHDKIIARDGVIVTEENIENYLRSFEFYDIAHAGYNIWGVYPVEVKE